MKIAITGADGLLGSNLVRLLLNEGHEINVIIHSSSKSSTLQGLPIQFYEGDILIPESLTQALHGCQAVIHAAANTSVWPARSQIVREVNIQGTKNVFNKALELGIERFILIGSASSVNAGGASEEYRFAGEKYGLDYIDSKYEAMQYVLNHPTQKMFKMAILPTFMIGAYDSLPSSGKLILTLARGKLRFYSKGGRNFVNVKDVAEAIKNGLTMGENNHYYVAGGHNLTYKEYFKLVSSIVNQPAPKIQVPSFIIRLIGQMGTILGKLKGSAPMISKEIARISCDLQFVDDQQIQQDLKMSNSSIESAIEDCYNWFKENNYLK